MQQCFIIFSILILFSCGQKRQQEDKLLSGDTTTKIKQDTNKHKVKIDTTFPCQLLNPDTSVFDIILLDRKSSIRQVGEKFSLIEDNKDMPHESFCSLDKKQTMTLFFHYGGTKNAFSEFQVKYYSDTDNVSTVKTKEFISGKGIKLGLSKKKVISVFGDCFKTINTKKNSEIIKYHIDDNNSKFLKHFNYPSYYAEYEFRNDKLVRYRFGFEYP